MTATMATQPRQWFAEQLEHHRGIVLKVAASYSRNADDRAELAQEIAAQLWQAFPRYDEGRPFATWMYRIALNVAISSLRRQRMPTPVPLDDAMHDMADPQVRDPALEHQVRALHRFIHAQAPLDRALLLLYLEDRSYREMSEILGLTETNVATKIHRLKQRIRDAL